MTTTEQLRTDFNWEALQVALERVRINYIAGRPDLVKSEINYLMDHLIAIQKQVTRAKANDDN